MALLPVAVSDLKRLCGISPADLSQDTALMALLLAEQPVAEYALDPGMLTRAVLSTIAPPAFDFPGLNSTLTLGVAEVLAGSYLSDLGRFPHLAEPLPLSALVPQAAAVLMVAVSDLKRLLQVDVADTTQDVSLAAVIAAEQLALEYALDPAVLAAAVDVATPNAGLRAWLTLGVSEQLAGHALTQAGRVPGIADDVQISSLHFTTSRGIQPDKLGAELALQGTDRLLPFSRHIRAEHALKPVLNQPDLIKLGADLSARGLSRLEPFRRAKNSFNREAGGLVPDLDADIPQLAASSVLAGAAAGVAASVFTEVFAEDVAGFEADLSRAEGDGMVWWGNSTLSGGSSS